MATENTTRLSVDLGEELAKELEFIPWGLKSEVVRKLLRLLVLDIQKHGRGVVTFLLDDTYNPLRKEVNNNDR